jgi:hypothetical protein
MANKTVKKDITSQIFYKTSLFDRLLPLNISLHILLQIIIVTTLKAKRNS